MELPVLELGWTNSQNESINHKLNIQKMCNMSHEKLVQIKSHKVIVPCMPGKVTAVPAASQSAKAGKGLQNKQTCVSSAQFYQQDPNSTDTRRNKHQTLLLSFVLLPSPTVDAGSGPKDNPRGLTNASYIYWTQLNSSMGTTCREEGKKPLMNCLIWLVVSTAKQRDMQLHMLGLRRKP